MPSTMSVNQRRGVDGDARELEGVSNKIGVKEAAQKVSGLGRWRGRRHRRSHVSAPRLGRNRLPTEAWHCAKVNQALRLCEDRHAEIDASGVSHVFNMLDFLKVDVFSLCSLANWSWSDGQCF